ncbi:MAG: polyribonucleotide nucleotidyltransferase, partial [Dysosmobacter sp.]
GTSAALAISDIPWNGPVGAVKMGLVDGELVINPNSEQRKVSDLDVTVVSTGKKVVMIEAGANEVPNDKMFEAIQKAHEENQKQIELINKMVAEIGKPKFDYPHAAFDQELFDDIVANFMDEAKAAMDTDDKNVREQRWNAMIEKWHEKYLDTHPDMDQYLEEITYKFQKKIVKAWLLEGHRVDGRQRNEIRPLSAEVGVLPRVHGSGLFTRGQTQVLSVCTLDTLSACQKLDTIWEETEKRYMHHYNFPGYSVGEAKPARSPGRREIGHGALAERALLPVIPSVEEFPYAIRVVSEVVSSNGSTSQGSICGSTLALMDAGVPIKAPVAGISCGLIQDDNGGFTTFIDIQGVEDFHGEMDFKVAGTKKGITAIQMDLKNDGLTMEIIKNALDITYDARCEILDQIMLPCISEPRKEVSKYAPKMIIMHINPDNIRDVIGKGGSVIQKIVADTGAKIDIDDDGTIHIAAADASACDAAKKCIDDIVFVPEIGKLYYGRVVRLMTFGAFVELAPGKDGLVHISKLADHRIEKVEDACKIGDMMWVKVTDIDEKGRVNLSHKDAMKEIAAKEANGERVK